MAWKKELSYPGDLIKCRMTKQHVQELIDNMRYRHIG